MRNIFEQIEAAETELTKELSEKEIEQLVFDAERDHDGDLARHYPEDSVMREIIEEAHTVEGTDFLNKLRDELELRESNKGRSKR